MPMSNCAKQSSPGNKTMQKNTGKTICIVIVRETHLKCLDYRHL